MTDNAPQRVWRAACPNCGAPVEFRSAASASAVCSFCRSTLVREGEALRRIGQSAELFDDHSPLRLGATGRFQGEGFALVGRVQMAYEGGTWNEWHALFDTGRSAWLSEDNGRYVLAFDRPQARDLPGAEGLIAGARRFVDGAHWAVASVQTARVQAAEGELPQAPRAPGSPGFLVADLRNERDEVGTLDYRELTAPTWSVGRPVRLAELAMQGLADAPAEKAMASRSVECPSCGAALEVKLQTTQAIVCHQCKAVVDLRARLGDGFAHYAQGEAREHLEPLIPLGRSGRLTLGAGGALPWQVVGYGEHCETGVDDGESQSLWREYLLYHRQEGFAFLVDAEDGWSWARPLTGAPLVRGDVATWQGISYRKRYAYTGQITWVLGEFYWRVARGERTLHVDYASGRRRLNREQTGPEVTWSAGEALEAKDVAQAFALGDDALPTLRRSTTPSDTGVTSEGAGALRTIFWVTLVVIVVLLVLRCSDDDCRAIREAYGSASVEYQQCQRNAGSGVRGGSWGGFSSGGGHK